MQRVKIRPEYQDKGDADIVYRVVEDNGERLIIEADLGWAINPQQIVKWYMVEFVEG